MEEFRYAMFDLECAAMKAAEAIESFGKLAELLPNISEEIVILEMKSARGSVID